KTEDASNRGADDPFKPQHGTKAQVGDGPLRERLGTFRLELAEHQRGTAERGREQHVVAFEKAVCAACLRLQHLQGGERVTRRQLAAEKSRKPRGQLELVPLRATPRLVFGKRDGSSDRAANDREESLGEGLRFEIWRCLDYFVAELLEKQRGLGQGAFAIRVHLARQVRPIAERDAQLARSTSDFVEEVPGWWRRVVGGGELGSGADVEQRRAVTHRAREHVLLRKPEPALAFVRSTGIPAARGFHTEQTAT